MSKVVKQLERYDVRMTWFNQAPGWECDGSIPLPVVPIEYGNARVARVENVEPPAMLSAESLAWVEEQANRREPRYDWNKTVMFARMNGVKL